VSRRSAGQFYRGPLCPPIPPAYFVPTKVPTPQDWAPIVRDLEAALETLRDLPGS